MINDATLIVILCLIGILAIAITIILYVYKSEIANEKEKESYKETCVGCKYLTMYNDGHVECFLGIEHVCIDNKLNLRYFKEEENKTE